MNQQWKRKIDVFLQASILKIQNLLKSVNMRVKINDIHVHQKKIDKRTELLL